MFMCLKNFQFIGLVLLLSIGKVSYAEPDNVPILVLVDTSAELGVDYRSGGRLARSLILLGGLLDFAIDSAENESDSEKLRKAVGEFDRKAIVDAGFVGGFSIQQHFKVSTDNPDGVYGSATKPHLDEIRAAGFSHVLTVEEEFAGHISAWQMSTLSATSLLSYRLIDTESGKTLANDRINGYASPKYTFEEATSKRELLVADYPQAVSAAVGRIIGDLRKNGFLHIIALKYDMGDKVPDTTAILEKYERRFSYKFERPEGWNTLDMNTKYVTVLSPEADQAVYGLNITFDLLLEEFSQRVGTAEDYARIFLKRAKTTGYDLVPNELSELELNDDHKVYAIKHRDNGALNILLLKKLDDNFVVIYSIVLLKNFEELYTRHKASIESIVNTARIKTK